MRATVLPGLLTLAACTRDGGLTKFNSPPEAQITAPAEGERVREGSTLTLRGQASDANHATGELLARWFLDDAEACASAPPAADGTTTCAVTVPAAESVLARLEVLDPEGASGVARVTLVVTPDAPPTASITSPTGDGVYYSDALVTLGALLGDDVDAPDALGVRWVSSQDGELAAPSTVTSTGQAEAFARFSEGEHALQLFVTDSAGNEVIDSVVFRVGPPNSAPSCGILAPADGGVGRADERVDLRAEVADVDVAATLLSAQWSSDKDGVLGSSTPDSDGSVEFSATGLSVDTHRLSILVTDEVGAVCSDSVTWTVGTAPTVTLEAPLLGEVVNESTAVAFEALASDGEDAPEALLVTWESSVDGLLEAGPPDGAGGSRFVRSDLSPGEHLLTVTVTDTSGLTGTAVGSVRVNGLPTAPGVSLSPTTPRTDDALTAVLDIASTDAEGDPLTYAWAWSRDGVLSGASSTAVLPASATTRGERWRVEVWASDGLGEGPVGSASVTIANTPPTLAAATLSPAVPTRSDTLTCASSGGSDADGDTVGVTFAWTIDGAAAGSGASLSGPFTTGARVTCTATPNDGTDAGAPVTATVTITNAAPVVSTVTLTPSAPATNDTLTASVVASDADGDSVTLAWAWYVDGALVPGASGPTLAGADHFDRDQTVRVEVTPSDASGPGATVASADVTVVNTPPGAPGIALGPAGATTGDDLTCAVSTAAVDIDGDAVTYAFAWDVDGAGYGGASETATTSTVPGSAVAHDATWTCDVVADDGTDTGAAASASLTVAFPYACTEATRGASTYAFCTDLLLWADAEAACVEWGGHLVTIDNSSEDSWLISTSEGVLPFASGGKWWIGLHDGASEGRFAWVTGAGVGYTNWGSGEPNNSYYAGVQEDCTVLKWASYPSGWWNDLPCAGVVDSYQTFICEG